MPSRSRTTLGTVTLVVIISVCFLVFSGLSRTLFSSNGRTVEAVFANTARMYPGTPVRVHGVEVGAVTRLLTDPGGRSTTVQMGITAGGVLPLHQNATAQLKWRTLLGANYVVELDPGTRAAGELNPAVIPLARTTSQVELDEILATLQAQQRSGLQTIVAELPKAVRDHAAPGAALSALARVAPAVASGVSAARGSQAGDLKALVEGAARTVQALDTRTPTLRDVVDGGAATAQTTAARSADIESLIALGAAVLPRVRMTAAQLDTTLAAADPLLAQLMPVAPHVAPTISQLTPTVVTANTLLRRATPLLRSLRPAASALASAAHAGRPLLDQLTPSLDRLANRILPDLAKPYRESHRPTYEMIGPTLADLDAASASYDGVSHFVTLTAGGGERALDTLPCRGFLFDPSAQQLVQCESNEQVLQGLLGYRPVSAGARK